MFKPKHIIFLCTFIFVSIVSAQTVYVTNTGKKYHEGSCRYLHSSSISMTLQNAHDSGYEPCKVCKPPVYYGTTKSNDQKLEEKATTSQQCIAMTKKGKRCKRSTKDPSGRCWQHQ